MDFSLLLQNLLSPPVLFFLLGAMATFVKSDLELPEPIPKVLSLYLLLAIGFKGGVELSAAGLDRHALLTLGAAMVMACVVPFYAYPLLRRRLGAPDAAAIAATYGSISAVTFITAISFLGQLGVPFSGHMIAAMALMESPAIIIAVVFARVAAAGGRPVAWGALGRDALLNSSVLLLLGALVIGTLTGARGRTMMEPFTHGLFSGVLALFLLDLGLVAARQVRQLRAVGLFCAGFALGVPLLNAALGLGLAWLLQLRPGDALLFVILCASASYIAVPAAMRLAIPQANAGIYVTMSLALTFPFNILVGIPLYWSLVQWAR